MGGNKHKNGIVCMFPGCEKTMRTQKFKLHFTKQHLKPGEVYTVEHRRRFEVARDEEYTSDAAVPMHKLEQQQQQQHQQQQLSMSVQIPATYQQQVSAAASLAASSAAVVADGSMGLTPTFTPTASSADVTTAESAVAAAVKKQIDAAHSQALLIDDAVNQQSQLLEEQRRLNRLTQQQQVADVRFGYTPPAAVANTSALISPSPNKRPASALEPPASVEASPPALKTSSQQGQQDPSRAVLVEYIEMMDQRFRELIQKMSQVIEGQRELIEMLRRPFPAETAQLLDQTPSLATSPSDALNADDSAKKRRKLTTGADQQQANGAAQRPSTSSNDGITSALL